MHTNEPNPDYKLSNPNVTKYLNSIFEDYHTLVHQTPEGIFYEDSFYQKLLDLLLTIETPSGRVRMDLSEIYDIKWNRHSDDLVPYTEEF